MAFAVLSRPPDGDSGGLSSRALVRRPLDQLTEGARRIADGDFGHEIRVSGSGQHSALAETLNAMSARLAATFDQLEHDREQLRAILSGMVEGVIAIDDERRVLFANDRAGELLGFDPAAAVERAAAGRDAASRRSTRSSRRGWPRPGRTARNSN